MVRHNVNNMHDCPYCGQPTPRERACANCADLPALDPIHTVGDLFADGQSAYDPAGVRDRDDERER